MAIVIVVVMLAAVVGAVLFMRSRSKSRPPLATTPFTQWDITYSDGCPPTMTKQPNGEYTVDIPAAPGSIHYVTTAAPPVGATIKMVFAVQGTGTIIPKPDADQPPARLALYMQRKGDTMTGAGEYEFYRWWFRDRIEITKPGEYAVTAPLEPAQWTSVYGRSGADPLAGNLFQAALANLSVVGFTFGGASFAGHGNQSTGGPVTFVLRSFTTQ